MSSWSRSPGLHAVALLAGAIGSYTFVEPASAQQTSFVPQVEASAEWASNRTLNATTPVSGSDESIRMGADLTRRTQISSLDLRPVLTFQNGSIPNLDRFEALVDLVADYRTLRGKYSANAEYHREDSFNAQFGAAGFNPLNPNVPDTAGTGAILTGITKTTYHIQPEAAYQLTQRTSVDATASMDAIRYSVDVPGELVSYNSPGAELDVIWAPSQVSQFGFGPYYSRYDPIRRDVGSVLTNSYGLNANYTRKSSQYSWSKVVLRAERDSQPQLGGGTSTVTSWGVEWSGLQKFRLGQIRYTVGRLLEPSSFGGRTAIEQVRFQYARPLTARLQFNGAVRLTRNHDIGTSFIPGENSDVNRDRANIQATLRWSITELWFVSGGYRFAYQNLRSGSGSANSNGAFITVGYHGREPQE